MAFVTMYRTPGGVLEQYRSVTAELGDEPVNGRLAVVAGEAGGELYVMEVWDSRASADRFASDRLFPAFTRAGVSPGPDSVGVSFETDEVRLTAAEGAGR